MDGDRSPTQRTLTRDDVERYLAASFDPAPHLLDCTPLTGGGFAAVWSVELADGRAMVLKVGPPPQVPLLRYERGMIAAEARYLRLVAAQAPQAPVPALLHHGVDPAGGDWLVVDRLPGRNLPALADCAEPPDDSAARRDLGAAYAALHRVTGDRFGYDGGRAGAATWSAAFAAIVDDLLADAVDWSVPLPVPAGEIRSLVARHAGLLDTVRRPALLHWDGWDGNVLAAADSGGVLRMTGLVDGERFLYGDPVMDLVSPLLFRRAEQEPEHPFLQGYRAAAGDAAVDLTDEAVRRRLGLYRLHLYLLMLVEMPSRHMSDPGRSEFLTDLLVQEAVRLGRGSRRAGW
ncbi:phosphotransferase family protein [Micromonospora sp. NBC_01813]|uniref:phosphotransferase family protein n=1 Tax=Micromonospora sp. NBC_01813 TaxID=2975988 RepID=UPI002DDA2184|nr:aminoglycoside phosphotransferase family protein [Micromonospora sp. NBC_01813]WSA10987.1 aminoglycoside phosphotransferase family protein [Micromonospora sp. NBC_01813]